MKALSLAKEKNMVVGCNEPNKSTVRLEGTERSDKAWFINWHQADFVHSSGRDHRPNWSLSRRMAHVTDFLLGIFMHT